MLTKLLSYEKRKQKKEEKRKRKKQTKEKRLKQIILIRMDVIKF